MFNKKAAYTRYNSVLYLCKGKVLTLIYSISAFVPWTMDYLTLAKSETSN